MAKTRINTSAALSCGPHADTAKHKVMSAKNCVNDVNWQLDGEIKNRNNIGLRLNKLASLLGDIESRVGRIKTTVDNSACTYQRADDHVTAIALELADASAIGN